MPSAWRIRRIKGKYYLYHYDEYVGPIEKIVEEWRRGRDLNPRGESPTGLAERNLVRKLPLMTAL
ncbi:MAG: hypothetical protein QXJ03_04245 [Desulfurococcus sp.]|uniref:hypothetical protein n=1 Tax=Desulfurococcus sp. TaxID=51678 RepID=UPI003164FAF8